MTALASTDPTVPGGESERGRLRLRLFAGPERAFTLADGVRVHQASPPGRGLQVRPLAAHLDGAPATLRQEGGAWVVQGRPRRSASSLVVQTPAGPWTVRLEGPTQGLRELVATLVP